MSYETLVLTIKSKWGGVALAGLLAGSLAFFSLVIFSKHFKVTTDFLVVQTGTEQSQDFYSMLKSSEYLGKVLSESVQSEKFIGAVVETGGVDGNFLPGNPKDRLDAWEKMAKVTNNPDVGTLHVEIYGNDDREALHVAQAVGKVMTEENMLFRSGNEKSVEIRTLSGPIVEKNPDMTRMLLTAIAGLFFGVSAYLLYVLMNVETKTRRQSFFGFSAGNDSIMPMTQNVSGVPASEEKPKEKMVASERVYTDSRLAFFEK